MSSPIKSSCFLNWTCFGGATCSHAVYTQSLFLGWEQLGEQGHLVTFVSTVLPSLVQGLHCP